MTGPPVQIYGPAFVTFTRGISHPCDTVELPDVEPGNAPEFIDASPNFYEGGRQTKIHGSRALGSLVSPEINLEPGAMDPDGTVLCPTSKLEAIFRIERDIGWLL